MNITIDLTYLTYGIQVKRSGTFPSKGKTPEKVTRDWIKEIKKEMAVQTILEVIVDGNINITERVLTLITEE